jgi:hypothetical protein
MSEVINTGLINVRPRTIRFYACGGTAINQLRAYRDNHPGEPRLHGDEKYSYIDTSFANLDGALMSETFTLKEADGSGSDRKKNAARIVGVLPEIMLAHQPADFNVVIFSLSGGTGSVAGPIILKELLAKGHKAVGVTSAAFTSGKKSSNAIDTLTGLELAVASVGRPVVLSYTPNDPNKTDSDNNIKPLFVLQTLAKLASGKNGHLDSSDVANLFDFHTVTNYKPSLALLDVYAGEEQLKSDVTNAIGIAGLLKDRTSVMPAINAAYDTVGYLPEDNREFANSFYFVVSIEKLNGVVKDMSERKAQAELKERVTNTVSTLATAGVVVDEATGLVL